MAGLIRNHGNTTAEYAIFISLFVLFTVAALRMLGTSTANLLSNTGNQVASSEMSNYLTLQYNSGTTSQAAKPLAIDSQTGSISTSINTAATAVNVSSIDGMVSSSQATLLVASKLDRITTEITDPTVLSWAQKITLASHYIAGAEGDFAGVQQLMVNISHGNQTYTEANALKDIYHQQLALQQLINNPPKNGNPEQIQQVLSLAGNVNSNTSPFLSNLNPYLQKNGNLDNGLLSRSSFASGQGNDKMTGQQYKDLVKYNTLQQNVTTVLQDGTASDSSSLQSTLQDASTLRSSQGQP